MEGNNKQYNKIVEEKVLYEFGHKSGEDWQQCLRTNSTYLDCPGAEQKGDWNVAVHNPSSLDLESAKISIADNMNYNVQVFNTESQTFEHAYAEKSCFDDHNDADRNYTQI